MPGGMIERRGAIAAKIEAIPGTLEAVTWSTDAFITTEVTIDPLDTLEALERHPLAVHFSSQQPVVGKGHGAAKISVPLIAHRAAIDAAPPAGLAALFAACSMAGTQQASTSYTYKPTSLSTPISIRVPIDGKEYCLKGAVGTFEIVCENGKFPRADFSFMGAYHKPGDLALPTPTLQNFIPPPFLSAAFNLFGRGTKPIVNGFKLDLGNKLVGREDVNAGAGGVPGGLGYRAFLVTDRAPKFSCQAEEELAADFDWWDKVAGNVAGAFTTGVIGATVGSRVKVDCANIGFTGIKKASREGLVALDLEGIPTTTDINAGNDELAIVFS